ASFETPAGLVFARGRCSLAPGQRGVLALRPEDLRLTRERRDCVNSLPARIERVSYLGSVTSVGTRVGELAVTVTVPRGQEPVAEGDDLFVEWPSTMGVLLEEAADAQ